MQGLEPRLKFAKPFDVTLLARAKPTVADHRWVAPDYLRNGAEHESAWNRVSLDDIEGFLKR